MERITVEGNAETAYAGKPFLKLVLHWRSYIVCVILTLDRTCVILVSMDESWDESCVKRLQAEIADLEQILAGEKWQLQDVRPAPGPTVLSTDSLPLQQDTISPENPKASITVPPLENAKGVCHRPT
jgi:hypothetical protein